MVTARARLDAFLRTDPREVGCDQAVEVLHVYAELVSRDPEAAGEHFAGVAVHLASCGPCREDLLGLLAAISSET